MSSDAWRDEKQPGRPMKLTRAQRRRLVKILLKGALNYGFENDLWTLKRVAQVIKREFDITYNVTHVWRVLRGLGLTAQVPLKQALEQDEDYIKEWLEERWPKLYRKARESGSNVVFVDESGLSNEPNVTRTWTPRDLRPKLKHSAVQRKLSFISAVTMDTELFFGVHDHVMTGAEVVLFLDKLAKRIPRMMLLWDNASIHRNFEVREFPSIISVGQEKQERPRWLWPRLSFYLIFSLSHSFLQYALEPRGGSGSRRPR